MYYEYESFDSSYQYKLDQQTSFVTTSNYYTYICIITESSQPNQYSSKPTRKDTGNGNGIISERLPQMGRENDRRPIHCRRPGSVGSTFGY